MPSPFRTLELPAGQAPRDAASLFLSFKAKVSARSRAVVVTLAQGMPSRVKESFAKRCLQSGRSDLAAVVFPGRVLVDDHIDVKGEGDGEGRSASRMSWRRPSLESTLVGSPESASKKKSLDDAHDHDHHHQQYNEPNASQTLQAHPQAHTLPSSPSTQRTSPPTPTPPTPPTPGASTLDSHTHSPPARPRTRRELRREMSRTLSGVSFSEFGAVFPGSTSTSNTNSKNPFVQQHQRGGSLPSSGSNPFLSRASMDSTGVGPIQASATGPTPARTPVSEFGLGLPPSASSSLPLPRSHAPSQRPMSAYSPRPLSSYAHRPTSSYSITTSTSKTTAWATAYLTSSPTATTSSPSSSSPNPSPPTNLEEQKEDQDEDEDEDAPHTADKGCFIAGEFRGVDLSLDDHPFGSYFGGKDSLGAGDRDEGAWSLAVDEVPYAIPDLGSAMRVGGPGEGGGGFGRW